MHPPLINLSNLPPWHCTKLLTSEKLQQYSARTSLHTLYIILGKSDDWERQISGTWTCHPKLPSWNGWQAQHQPHFVKNLEVVIVATLPVVHSLQSKCWSEEFWSFQTESRITEVCNILQQMSEYFYLNKSIYKLSERKT